MKARYIPVIAIALTTSAAYAESNYTLAYQTIDASLTFGGATFSGDGSGITGQFTHTMDNGIGFLGSYSSMNGDIANATWSLTSTTLGVGYELVDSLTVNSGARVIVGVGYTNFDGEVSGNGQTVTSDGDYTSALIDVTGRINETMSISAGLTADLEGDVDPTFAVGLNYDITDNGAISIGYSSNSTSDAGVTTELTGWTIGWTSTF